MTSKQSATPEIQYPDSSKCYTFDDIEKIIKVLKSSNPVPIKKPEQQKLAKLILDLNEARATGSNHIIQKRYQTFVENVTALRLEPHEINEILNAILINENEYAIRGPTVYSLRDVVLFLLCAHPERPICGRIMITKQAFLAIKEILGDAQVENPRFVPYRYGPYSFTLAHTLSNMKYDGFIDVNGKKNTQSELFLLTDRGMKIASEKFNTLTKKQQNMLADKRKSWDQLHQRGILSYVYDKYPEYTSNSRIAHIYKSITWGRGTG